MQEWVISHPSILGDGVRVVTFEFDRWTSKAGDPRDRLDVLGLDQTGRLVVAELKRGTAPDTTEMQAIKYAAMASRFTVEALVGRYIEFAARQGHSVVPEEALDELQEHAGRELADDGLKSPRIVLAAEGFGVTTTTAAVWLSEQGVDITLMTYRAYRLPDGQVVVSTSQLFPVPNAEDMTAGPKSKEASAAVQDLGDTPWTAEELTRLIGVASDCTLQVLDRLAAAPEKQLDAHQLAQPEFEAKNVYGSLGGLVYSARRRFERNNAPLTFIHTADGWRYLMTAEQAADWSAARGVVDEETLTVEESQPLGATPTT